MSMHLEFEPHSWYMGFAIRDNVKSGVDSGNLENPLNSKYAFKYSAYIDDGMTYRIDERHADTITELKSHIREYHLCKHNGYGERIARRRLEELRQALRAENISYGELAELFKLHEYIEAGDVELLEAAGVPEGNR